MNASGKMCIVNLKKTFQHSHDTSRQLHTCVIPEAVMQFNAPDNERKYRSKHVEQPGNNKLSYTVTSSWLFSYIVENLCLSKLESQMVSL